MYHGQKLLDLLELELKVVVYLYDVGARTELRFFGRAESS